MCFCFFTRKLHRALTCSTSAESRNLKGMKLGCMPTLLTGVEKEIKSSFTILYCINNDLLVPCGAEIDVFKYYIEELKKIQPRTPMLRSLSWSSISLKTSSSMKSVTITFTFCPVVSPKTNENVGSAIYIVHCALLQMTNKSIFVDVIQSRHTKV